MGAFCVEPFQFAPEIDFELPFQLNYQQIPPAGKNIGITALNAHRSDTRWDVFVRVEGTKPASLEPTMRPRRRPSPCFKTARSWRTK